MNLALDFNGPAYDAELDQERLGQQHERIRGLMMDGRWRTLADIAQSTGYPEGSISAQLRHLRKPQFGGYLVERQRVGAPHAGLWAYRVLPGVTCSNEPKKARAAERIRAMADRIAELEQKVRLLGGEP